MPQGMLLRRLRGTSSVIPPVLPTASFVRGINLVDGGGADAFTITNVSRGTFATTYAYPTAADFTFLAGRGMKHAQVQFMLERVYPTLGGAANATELSRLTTVANSAQAVGMQVIFQSFNKGQYRTTAGSQVFGSAGYTSANFANAMNRLGQTFESHAGVWGISLQNEPHFISSVATHESIMQAAVTAMRGGGFTKPIGVPIRQFSTPQRLADHTSGPWVTDPLDNLAYEVHLYWWALLGVENTTYAGLLTDAQGRGYTAGVNTDALHTRALDELSWVNTWLARKTPKPDCIVGEWGNPNLTESFWVGEASGDQARWNALWNRCLTQMDTYGWHAMTWDAGNWADWYKPYHNGFSPTLNTPQPNAGPLETHPSRIITGHQPSALTAVATPLLTDSQAAAKVNFHGWEPRSANATANARVPTTLEASTFRTAAGTSIYAPYLALITGNPGARVGGGTWTTDELIQWASWKWGLNEDTYRAVCANESAWTQSAVSSDGSSHGLTQIKDVSVSGGFAWPGTFPLARDSTPFNLDFLGAHYRQMYDGHLASPPTGYTSGDFDGCIGAWYSGLWNDPTAVTYTAHIHLLESQKIWETYGGYTGQNG